MTIQIDYETEKKLDIDYTQLANRVAHKILETEQCPYEASVNLVITENDQCAHRRTFISYDPVSVSCRLFHY